LSAFSPPDRKNAAVEKVVARVAIASWWAVSTALGVNTLHAVPVQYGCDCGPIASPF